MAGWHHRLNGHGFGGTPGVGDGQGGLVCCDSWGHKESDMTEGLNSLTDLLVCAAATAKSHQSCPTLCDPIDGTQQAPLSLGFSRQEYWSGLPFPSPSKELVPVYPLLVFTITQLTYFVKRKQCKKNLQSN